MGLAILVHFDKVFSSYIQSIWIPKGSEEKHDYGNTPHMSFAVYDIDDPDVEKDLLKAVKKLKCPNMQLSFSGVGVFPTAEPSVYLAPKVSMELLKFHEYLHHSLKKFEKYCRPYYLPKNWIPHVCINLRVEESFFDKDFSLLLNNYKTINAHFTQLSLGRFEPFGIVYSTCLKKEDD